MTLSGMRWLVKWHYTFRAWDGVSAVLTLGVAPHESRATPFIMRHGNRRLAAARRAALIRART